MAVLRCLLALFLIFPAAFAHAHMGRTIQLFHPDGVEESLAANIVAAYMGEQMGREIVAKGRGRAASCLEGILEKESPMALLPENVWTGSRAGLTRVGPTVRMGEARYVLIMGQEAAGQLQFSLVPRYLATLTEVLKGMDLERWIGSVRRGSGARKVALDLLREGDIL